MPATSIFRSAASSAMSGMSTSQNSVLLGPPRTAACTFSVIFHRCSVVVPGDSRFWVPHPTGRVGSSDRKHPVALAVDERRGAIARGGIIGPLQRSPERLRCIHVFAPRAIGFRHPIVAQLLLEQVHLSRPGRGARQRPSAPAVVVVDDGN